MTSEGWDVCYKEDEKSYLLYRGRGTEVGIGVLGKTQPLVFCWGNPHLNYEVVFAICSIWCKYSHRG